MQHGRACAADVRQIKAVPDSGTLIPQREYGARESVHQHECAPFSRPLSALGAEHASSEVTGACCLYRLKEAHRPRDAAGL